MKSLQFIFIAYTLPIYLDSFLESSLFSEETENKFLSFVEEIWKYLPNN